MLSPMFPGVTAVLVVQHGGDRLATTLEALRAQLRPSDALAVVLMRTDDEAGDWGRAATADLIRNRIKVKSLNFMRGAPSSTSTSSSTRRRTSRPSR